MTKFSHILEIQIIGIEKKFAGLRFAILRNEILDSEK